MSLCRGGGRIARAREWVPADISPKSKAPPVHHKDIEEGIEVKNLEQGWQEEEVHVDTTSIPHIDPVIAENSMLFFKGFAGPGVLPSIKAT